MNIYAPTTYDELKNRIKETANNNELCAIRYPRGCENKNYSHEISGDYTLISKNSSRAIITYGRLFSNAVDAQNDSDCDILKLNRIYPLSDELLTILTKYDELFFFEETVSRGSISELLGSLLVKNNYVGKYSAYTIADEFVVHSSVTSALRKYKLDTDSMIEILNKH